MRVECYLPVDARVASSDRAPAPVSLTVDGAEAKALFHVEDGFIEAITLSIPNQLLGADGEATEQAMALAYRLCAYIANYIYFQTKADAIHLNDIVRKKPWFKRCPENADEEEKILSYVEEQLTWDLGDKVFDLSTLHARLTDFTNVLAIFADAQRTTDPFIKCGLFYMVLKWYCNDRRDTHEVPWFVAHFHKNCPRFSGKGKNEVKNILCDLKKVRHAVFHTRPRARSPLDRDDLNALGEVRKKASEAHQLALWILQNPPPSSEAPS